MFNILVIISSYNYFKCEDFSTIGTFFEGNEYFHEVFDNICIRLGVLNFLGGVLHFMLGNFTQFQSIIAKIHF